MLKHNAAGIVFLLFSLAACQAPDNQAQKTAAQEATATADTLQQRQPRPKPEFYSLKGVDRKRVYICMDSWEDTFHQQHDCPELVACKSTFRNLTLSRAVEAFDRYNCETCSGDLAFIFDENAARFETGFGDKE